MARVAPVASCRAIVPVTAAAENEKPSSDVALPPELFSAVSDLTSGFPGAEREAYYQILARARDGGDPG